MCLSKPTIPTPDVPQEVKQPDSAALAANAKKNRTGGMAGGSLLTGPSGVANAAASTGKTSLLGG
jgi:hypothetical protein